MSQVNTPVLVKVAKKHIRAVSTKSDGYLCLRDIQNGLPHSLPHSSAIRKKLSDRGKNEVIVALYDITKSIKDNPYFPYNNLFVSVNEINQFFSAVRAVYQDRRHPARDADFQKFLISLSQSVELSWDEHEYLTTKYGVFDLNNTTPDTSPQKLEVEKEVPQSVKEDTSLHQVSVMQVSDDAAMQAFFYEAVRSKAIANQYYWTSKRNADLLPPHLASQVGIAAKNFFKSNQS